MGPPEPTSSWNGITPVPFHGAGCIVYTKREGNVGILSEGKSPTRGPATLKGRPSSFIPLLPAFIPMLTFLLFPLTFDFFFLPFIFLLALTLCHFYHPILLSLSPACCVGSYFSSIWTKVLNPTQPCVQLGYPGPRSPSPGDL